MFSLHLPSVWHAAALSPWWMVGSILQVCARLCQKPLDKDIMTMPFMHANHISLAPRKPCITGRATALWRICLHGL